MSPRKINTKKPVSAGYVLGLAAIEKISAVEGISLTAGMKRDLKQLEAKRLGTEAERRFLVKKYGRSA